MGLTALLLGQRALAGRFGAEGDGAEAGPLDLQELLWMPARWGALPSLWGQAACLC